MSKLKTNQILLISILILAVFTRFYRLWEPPTYMFDEVYHAFTAVEMSKGNKMAWEWWNTPPKGFAYEWTHPPLAKEAMVVGIVILGDVFPKQPLGVDGRIDPNPFAWRFPGALLGVGIIYIIYLLGKELFNERAGLIASFLATLDGLIFVQSRIGMNDVYFLFFMLLAFYLYLKGKWLGVGVSLGLSLASKWTALYGIGVLGGLFWLQWLLSSIGVGGHEFSHPTLSPSILKSSHSTQSSNGRGSIVNVGLSKIMAHHPLNYLLQFVLIFLAIPIAIYLLSYLPFFMSGHNWSQFNELQHQMWWYHTNLKATHPYQSLWYTWPFLYRPVWFYVKYETGMIANIYAMGNPVIWWSGIMAVGWTVVVLLSRVASVARQPATTSKMLAGRAPRDSLALIIILFGYFGFFLPWALSPRIMFLYHYLPSVPFMCLALGFGLERIGRIGQGGKLLIISYLVLVAVVFIYFYPHLSALSIPTGLNDSYYWFKSWK